MEGKNNNLSEYLSGESLYGDDFNIDKIEAWYKDEKEAYADLCVRNRQYCYEYHAINIYHGYNHLPQKRRFQHILGIGSATGDELLPIIDRLDYITILEPSDFYSDKDIRGVPCRYVKPEISGNLPFSDSFFDLITCLGTLHHIPNVSHVITELARCLSTDGFMILREPIISMGDQRKPRLGLTKRERGIPLQLLYKMIKSAGLQIFHSVPCFFSPLNILAAKSGLQIYNSIFAVHIDAILSRLFYKYYRYHRTRLFHKFAPSSIFIVLKKSTNFHRSVEGLQ